MASIQEFYSGRSVFLTGASGFLGKQILEKLLRSCDVKDVYVLVRAKRGKSSEERKAELLKSKLFSILRVMRPNFESQVNLVPGDMTAERMGISDIDMQLLQENVSVVIHSAASVNFQEKLRDAISTNVIALQRMIEIVKSLPRLESFVHVSTAYVNCHQRFSAEYVYKPQKSPNEILDMIQNTKDDALEAATPKIISPWPNTYTFTKSLAEWLLVEQAGDLPCAIFRPSIISASAEEPLRGWVDNFNAATGMVAGIGSGFLRMLYGSGELIGDLVPVDMCANAIVALAYSTGTEKRSTIPVYNFTSGRLNPITYNQFHYWLQNFYHFQPLIYNLGYAKVTFTTNRFRIWINKYIFERVMMVLVDLMLRVRGKAPMLVKLHKRAHKSSKALEFFTTNEWDFESDNIPALYQSLVGEDKINFNFDITRVSWPEYFINYCNGIQKYAMKNENVSPEKQKKAVKVMKRWEFSNTIYKVILVGVLLALLWFFIEWSYKRLVANRVEY